MNIDQARRINDALTCAWMWLNVTGQRPSNEQLVVIREVSLAQAQTATEHIEAENAKMRSLPGNHVVRCMIDPAVLPEFLQRVKGITG